jgi:serine/threonine protein kinase
MMQCQACKREFNEQVRFCPFDGQSLKSEEVKEPAPKQSLIGRVLDGKFRLEARLRQESLATTYGATQIAIGRPVSVKVIPIDGEEDTAADSLRKQARQLAAIRHPNIVEVVEIGISQEPPAVYAATEFVDGMTLKKRLSQKGPLSEQEAAQVLRQVCSATQAVNSVGLFSPGLSSDNIWLDYSGGPSPKVKVDFVWLSEPLTPETKARIQRGEIASSPVYLSPEECRGEDPDGRSEVYRLGLIAYEMLAARPPFESDSIARLILMQLNEAPPPIESVVPHNGVPGVLEPAVMRALAKLAQFRHQSAADFGRAIDESEAALEKDVSQSAPAPDVASTHPQPFDSGESFVFDESPTARPLVDTGEAGKHASSDDSAAMPLVGASQAVTASVVPPEDLPAAPDFVFADTKERKGLSGTAHQPSGEKRSAKPFHLDETAEFTAFSPKVVMPLAWSRFLTFAHLSAIEEVTRQAELKLREEIDQYQTVAQPAVRIASREDEITLMPMLPGIEFNPPSATFLWQESTHAEDFLIRATSKVDGQMVRGRISVFLGSILLAEVPVNIRVDSRYSPLTGPTPYERNTADRFKKIYASFSPGDTSIASQFNRAAESFGEKYLRDVRDLRGPGVWGARLEKLMLEADVFQLFWSTHAMSYPLMRQEWEYALSLRRPGFVRPTYWEDPLPSSREQHLPPEELTRIGFQRIGAGAETSAISTSETTVMTGSLTSETLPAETNPPLPVVDYHDDSAFEFNETPPRSPEPVWSPPERQSESPRKDPEVHRPAMATNSQPSRVAAQPAPTPYVPPTTPQQVVSQPNQYAAPQTGYATPQPAGATPPAYYPNQLPYVAQPYPASQVPAESGSANLVLKVLVFVLLGSLLLLVGVYLLTRYWR